VSVSVNYDDALAAAAELLSASDDYRVLRRFAPRTRYAEQAWNLGDPDPARIGVFVDVEGTGLDTDRDEIIELAAIPFTYDPVRGVVFDVGPGVSFLEEPSIPISPEIQELTGISPEMVKGQRIDDDMVNAIVKKAAIVIAHAARYDRKMLERRLPAFCDVPWACSQSEVAWRAFGVAGGALANVLISACGEFPVDAHRALNDCQFGIHVLAAAQLDGRTALSYLLESARQPTRRVCALYSPMEAKDILRGRGYRALYQGGRFAYWYKDLREKVDEEMEWCREFAYADPRIQTLTARERYSARADA
jgi:DNA polymerase III subunit epsilon